MASSLAQGLSKTLLVDLSGADAKKWRPLIDQIEKTLAGAAIPDASTAEKYRAVKALRQQQTRLDEPAIQRLIAEYEGGATVYELADQFHCHRTTVSDLLKSCGVTMRRTPLSAAQIDQAVELYKSGLSLVKIGQRLGVNPETIRLRLIERGVEMRDAHGRARPRH